MTACRRCHKSRENLSHAAKLFVVHPPSKLPRAVQSFVLTGTHNVRAPVITHKHSPTTFL